MNLVLFTQHYPYGTGEEFLIEEIKIAEKKFKHILIVSYAKHTEKLNKYVPSNAKVITLRANKNYIESYYMLLKHLASACVWKEILYGCKERGFSKVISILKSVLLCERQIAFLKKKEFYWHNDNNFVKNTIYYSYWLSPAAVYLARNKERLNSVCVTRAHGGDCFFSRGFNPWRWFVLLKLDRIFPISEEGKKDILIHYENTIGKFLFDKVSVARLSVRLPLNINKNKYKKNSITIVSCSNVIPLKRLDILIDALVLCDFISIHWVHFGDGFLMSQIKEYAERTFEKNDKITYDFLGRVSKETILNYYDKHVVDLFINCSDVEGIPVSAMEAMSYGIPVIARNVGGNSELINNRCGILLPKLIMPKDLTVAIKTIIFSEDDISYQERCNNAYNVIAEKFNSEKNYNSFFEKVQRIRNDNA